MNIASIIILIALCLWVGGIIAYFIYRKVHHKPILEEDCALSSASKRLLRAYRKQKRLEAKKAKGL